MAAKMCTCCLRSRCLFCEMVFYTTVKGLLLLSALSLLLLVGSVKWWKGRNL